MGILNPDINEEYTKPIEQLIKPFLSCFSVTYGTLRKAANTNLYVYILQPDDFMIESYGFDKELFLAYAKYNSTEPRTLQAINIILNEYPFKNRVDNLNYFLISEDDNIEEWIQQYLFSYNSYQIPVVFSTNEIVNKISDTWYVRNKLNSNFYGTDLFGYTLPIQDDYRFFGRQQILARYIDAIKRGENRGIFGLRKTGKTSFLFKLERSIREQKLGYTYFYDCKTPANRKMHWNELLGAVCKNISKSLSIRINQNYDETSIYKSLQYVVTEAAKLNKKIILLFDEIEFISFNAPLDPHWKTEYIDFWQTLWALQSRNRNLSFVISGVNPSIIEIDTVNGIQNPLFGIVQSEYLQGLSEADTRIMIKYLGKRMGLKFNYESISFLFQQYNGHPMLTRLACSQISKLLSEERPVNITDKKIQSIIPEINSELKYYFKHVVSEIQQFYPDEYELFEIIACGHTADFLEFSQISEFVAHLYSYGLVANDDNNRPYIQLPVAGDYVAMCLAKKEGRKTKYKLIDSSKRESWVALRCQSIIRDIRQLEIMISKSNLPKLFGENSFPEADRFYQSKDVKSPSDFDTFINTCNRCFVESMENYGISKGNKNYFWDIIKKTYPDLFNTLHRIKVYRNYSDHLVLNKTVSELLLSFIAEDGENIEDINEMSYCIQQKLLDLLFSSIQIESEKLS